MSRPIPVDLVAVSKQAKGSAQQEPQEALEQRDLLVPPRRLEFQVLMELVAHLEPQELIVESRLTLLAGEI